MKFKTVNDRPMYRQDKNSALYEATINLPDGGSLEIENATRKEYNKLRVYFAYHPKSIRSQYLHDMAFSKGIRFTVRAVLNFEDNYTIWIQKRQMMQTRDR